MSGRRLASLLVSRIRPSIVRMSSSDSKNSSNADENNKSTVEYQNELIDTFLNLEKLDLNIFRAHHLMGGLKWSPTLYGGQAIGQALVAAKETVPEHLNPHSLHCYFVKAGNVSQPILYVVDRVRDGKSFATRFVKAIQNGDPIFTSEMSFHKTEPDSIRHQVEMPKVAPPEELEDAETVIRNFINNEEFSAERRKYMERRLDNMPTTFEVRPVDPIGYLRVKARPAKYHVWVRAKAKIGDDWRLHHCVAAYISDSAMIGTALLPHAAAGFKYGQIMSLDHSIWIHRCRFRIDEWMLYETESPIAAASRALIFGRLWTRDGVLALSTAQEGLIRAKL